MFKQYLIGLYIRYKGRDAAKNRAIKKAERLHAENGKRYRVFFLKNRYEVLSRQDIQHYKHTGEYGWHVNSTSMQPFCYFDTNPEIAERVKANNSSNIKAK
jgi:hypothetical protein